MAEYLEFDGHELVVEDDGVVTLYTAAGDDIVFPSSKVVDIILLLKKAEDIHVEREMTGKEVL